jgi:hypothetical protein
MGWAGFAPVDPKNTIMPVQGKVWFTDGSAYAGDSFFTATYKITQPQADKLMDFADKPTKYGFSLSYLANTNSCVDFVWKGLNVIGMNPNGSQGALFPMQNQAGFSTLSNPGFTNGGLVQVERITNAIGNNFIDGFKAISTSSNGSNWSAPTYTFSNANAAAEADNAVWAGLANGTVSKADFENIANASSNYLVNPVNTFTPSSFEFNHFIDPIGAFYDSQSSAFDNAASIANKTTRAMNAQGQGLSAAQLAALDTNNDGQLSTAESSGVRLWADVNEDGRLDSGELLSVSSPLKSADYGFYTRGSALTVSTSADAPLAPTINVPTQRPQALTVSAPSTPAAAVLPGVPTYEGVPASNYRSLRDTDNVYLFGNGNYVAFSPSQVKINNGNRTYMIGTDGADSFDGSTYANTGFFNNSLLVNFLGGGGNDEMGGSTRNDKLWGGTGNDTEYGYAGDDSVYGEEGDDVLCGQGANQTCAANDSTWRQAA